MGSGDVLLLLGWRAESVQAARDRHAASPVGQHNTALWLLRRSRWRPLGRGRQSLPMGSDIVSRVLIAGMPAHALISYHCWINPHGVMFVDWAAHCGQRGVTASPLNAASTARSGELCRRCFPQRHATVLPATIATTHGGTNP